MRYSVIIATWNAAAVLEACLESVGSQRLDGPVETIVVDNASTDGTSELLRRHGPRVATIRNDENLGFSEANNQGARAAAGDVLFFLNSDTTLSHTGTLQRLADELALPGVGLVGPRLVNPDGTLQPSCGAHPSVTGALIVGLGAHRALPDRLRARLAPAIWSHTHSIDTGWLTGAALAIRADVFAATGGFWPRLYGEDEDLARKVQRRGLSVRFVASAQVMHAGNYSNAQRWSDAERAARVASSEVAFLAENYARPRRAAIRAITLAGYGGRAVALRLMGRRARSREYGSMARVYLGAHEPSPSS